jgi:hypothetical protein
MGCINKKLISIPVFALIVIIYLCFAIAAKAERIGLDAIDGQQITQVLNEMFDALKSGDTGTLKSLFAGEMYATNKALLEQNIGYPEYLRDHYQGAVFTIVEMTHCEIGVIADIHILLKNKQEQIINLLLEKRGNDDRETTAPALPDNGSTSWVIIKHIQASR